MAKEGKSMATPRLRFSEFREAGEWNEKPLKDICAVNPSSDDLPESFVYIDLESVEGGNLNAKNHIAKKDAPSRAQRLLRNGDVVFQIVRPYQRNNLFVEFADNETYVASTGYAQLRAHGSERFLYQVVHTDPFVEKVIAKCTGSSYPAINSSDLADVYLFIPPILQEQQKIAACLTSLDEVITAQGQKVEALKTWKRGLMQQLFPREGETLPRLRFPEFHDAPEWEVKPLSGVCDMQAGKFVAASEISDKQEEGFYPCFGGNGLRGYTKTYTHSGKYPLIGRQGALCGNINFAEGFFHATEHAVAVTPKAHNSVDWLFYALGFLNLNRFATGQAQPGLSVEVIEKVTCVVPKFEEEQQKISDCLSSLDIRITVESEKFDALKTHKKGLMQQLFPSLEVD